MISSFPVSFYPMGSQYPAQISDDAGKIFVGGIPADATKETLSEYFSKFGNVSDCIIMVDNITGRSRGFGFVTFMDAVTVNKVLAANKHVINGKVVDAKKAVPKGPNQMSILRAMGVTSNRADRNPDCKIFVGGVPQGTTESDLETYFRDYGHVLEVKIPKDQNTQRARGFSFVLFDSPDSVIAATKENFHRINNKMVEVKPVEIQHNKHMYDGNSDDGHTQNASSPYQHLSQRSTYYGYPHQSYLPGFSPAISPHGFYENPYRPSPSGSTGSAASLDSAGFGGLSSSGARGQGIDNYSYMAPLYPAMADLSISQRYPGIKSYGHMHRPHYQLSAGGNQMPSLYTQTPTPSAASPVPYHSEYPANYTHNYASAGGTLAVHGASVPNSAAASSGNSGAAPQHPASANTMQSLTTVNNTSYNR